MSYLGLYFLVGEGKEGSCDRFTVFVFEQRQEGAGGSEGGEDVVPIKGLPETMVLLVQPTTAAKPGGVHNCPQA